MTWKKLKQNKQKNKNKNKIFFFWKLIHIYFLKSHPRLTKMIIHKSKFLKNKTKTSQGHTLISLPPRQLTNEDLQYIKKSYERNSS